MDISSIDLTLSTNENLGDLSTIDLVIISYAMVKVWREKMQNVAIENNKNKFIKLFASIIQNINQNNNFDYLFFITTTLNDNCSYIDNNFLQNNTFNLSNIGLFNSINSFELVYLHNINIVFLNKSLYEETYKFFTGYFCADETSENIEKYIKFLTQIFKKPSLSKIEYNSILLGIKTFKNIKEDDVINIEKVLCLLNDKYCISKMETLKKLNKICNNNEEVVIDNRNIDYALVHEITANCQ